MVSPAVEFTGLEEAKALFGDKVINDTIRSTVNKVARQSRTQLSRDVREIYNVKAAAVNRSLTVKTATGRGTEAFIFSLGRRIPLKEFGARKAARGVTVKVRRDRPRKLLPGHFIVESLGGNVFHRKGEKRRMVRGRYRGQLKQPIERRFSLSIPHMMRGRDTIDRLLRHAHDITPQIFQHELNFRIRRLVERSQRAAAQHAIR